MIGPWLEINVPLRVLTPLHVGTGETGLSPDILNEKTKESVEVALVAADGDHHPLIPGSTLKGVLRRALGQHPASEVLFGPAGISSAEEARAGKLTIWQARMDPGSIPEVKSTSYSDAALAINIDDAPPRSNRTHGSIGLFVEARTSIHEGLGVAKAGRLFHRQFVMPGVRFALCMGLLDPADETRAALKALLALMSDAEAGGVVLGTGTGLDQGRILLDRDGLIVRNHVLLTDGRLGFEDLSSEWRAALAMESAPTKAKPARRKRLRLACTGPFLVNDASAEKRRIDAASKDERAPAEDTDGPDSAQLTALTGFDDKADKPRLPGATLRGALRARALWLGRCAQAEYQDHKEAIAYPGEVAALSSAERIFGVNGWRALLQLEGLDCVSSKGWQNLTSVRIDRFSGAAVDGGLFTTRAAIKPLFSVTVTLERRGDWPLDADLAVFDNLMEDLQRNGLMLGHGTNRGYGWFDVEVEDA